MMHDDDAQVGRVLSRREVLASLGMAGVALALPKAMLEAGIPRPIGLPGGGVVPACVVRPEQMEGPYFVDTKLNRADIRSEPGAGDPEAGDAASAGVRGIAACRRRLRAAGRGAGRHLAV